MINLRLITRDNFLSALFSEKKPWQENYLAMYSTQWKGYVTDPALMMVPVDEQGNLAEGSNENVGVVTKEGILNFPGFENTLAGITVQRAYELAITLVRANVLKAVRFSNIPLEEAYRASEVFLTGTSIHVLPVVTYDGRTIGTGRPGPECRKLLDLMERDVRENEGLLTDIGWES